MSRKFKLYTYVCGKCSESFERTKMNFVRKPWCPQCKLARAGEFRSEFGGAWSSQSRVQRMAAYLDDTF